MSKDQAWKILHVLNWADRALDTGELAEAKIWDDQIFGLVDLGLLAVQDSDGRRLYPLTPTARTVLNTFFVAPRPAGGIIVVDDASAFLMMPYSMAWSDVVDRELIQGACTQAGLRLVRADRDMVQLGNLGDSLVQQICKAGVVIAVLTGGNPNVLYELGIANTLGKDAFILLQAGEQVPVDFSGVLRIEYELDNLVAARNRLGKQLEDWRREAGADKLRAVYGD